MGGVVGTGADNDELVDNLKAASYIKTPVVERVFRAVDRGDYFTAETRDQAYRDMAWRLKSLHLSAPCIYAQVVEGLDLSPGLSFLNLGSGTGYLSTMVGLIIGETGINHGVELHSSVIAYAQSKLAQFKDLSPAIDAFNFCEPRFVQGNCLNLIPSSNLYDRVYCGASCPESHEKYMKNLLKIGGILIMPLNEQLVKITRLSETNWKLVSLLPVSFSPLILPDITQQSVNLPPIVLPTLQEVCRRHIRGLLHYIVESEHPDLPTAAIHAVNPNQSSPNSSNLRRYFRPRGIHFRHHSDDEGGSDDQSFFDRRIQIFNPSHGSVEEGPASLYGFYVCSNRRSSHDMDVDEGEKEEEEEEEEEEEVEISEEESEKKGEEAVNKIENNKVENNAPEHKDMETMPAEEPELLEPVSASVTSEPSSPSVGNSKTNSTKREKFDSGVGDEIDSTQNSYTDENLGIESDSDSDFLDDSEGQEAMIRFMTLSRRVGALARESCLGGSKKSSPHSKDEDSELSQNDGRKKPQSAVEKYSIFMKEKIQLLPLPFLLKMYLNYNREL